MSINDRTTSDRRLPPPGVCSDGVGATSPVPPVPGERRSEGPGRSGPVSPIRDWSAGVPSYEDFVEAGLVREDDDDADSHDGDAAPRTTTGTCWVCQRTYESRLVAFGKDGDHAICATKAATMDASFQTQRQRRQHVSPLTSAGSVDWMSAKW